MRMVDWWRLRYQFILARSGVQRNYEITKFRRRGFFGRNFKISPISHFREIRNWRNDEILPTKKILVRNISFWHDHGLGIQRISEIRNFAEEVFGRYFSILPIFSISRNTKLAERRNSADHSSFNNTENRLAWEYNNIIQSYAIMIEHFCHLVNILDQIQ